MGPWEPASSSGCKPCLVGMVRSGLGPCRENLPAQPSRCTSALRECPAQPAPRAYSARAWRAGPGLTGSGCWLPGGCAGDSNGPGDQWLISGVCPGPGRDSNVPVLPCAPGWWAGRAHYRGDALDQLHLRKPLAEASSYCTRAAAVQVSVHEGPCSWEADGGRSRKAAA